MTVDVVVLIGATASACSIIFGYIGYSKALKKESNSEGKETGELKADTEYIKRRIGDVLLEQRETNKTLNMHAERLTRVEESAKQAHKRIDRLERGKENDIDERF